MAALESGYFAAEGLRENDLDLIYPGGLVPSMVERIALRLAMKEKAIDIVTDCKVETVLYQNSIGADLYIIAGWRNNLSRDAIFGSMAMKSLKELSGKRLGIRDLAGKGHTYSRFALTRVGMNPDRDVEWIRGIHADTEALEALKDGRVDAVHAVDRGRDLLETEGYPMLADSLREYPYGLPARLIVATGRILESVPDLVKAFLRGAIRGYWFYRDPANFEYIKDLLIRMRQAAWDEEERNLERHMKFLNPDHFERSPFPIDGSVARNGLETYLDEMKNEGLISTDYSLDKALKLDLVEEAYKELSERVALREQLEKAKAIAHRTSLNL
jgi:ABC-type nitrate/sulfonate/bicarbonate transport system substrate-binding protein